MNRRDFLGLLAGLPLLGFMKPEVVEATEEISTEDSLTVRFNYPEPWAESEGGKLVRWNGAGDSWESNDSGKTWTQMGFRPTLEIQPDGVLYVSGNFLEEDIEQVRQRHYEYYQARQDR